jgi:hypothetical protein
MTRWQRIRKKYTNYPVWIFYWWKAESRHRTLKEFRKTIVMDDAEAEKHDRQRSSAPVIEVGKIIDRYKTW